MSTSALVTLSTKEAPWKPLNGTILVGKDILELLSSSMYVDPMTIYREYVQNAADAIDDAVSAGLLAGPGQVDLTIDTDERTITIRDNGMGVDHESFVARMTSFGGSQKRGTTARGFRGVGRLAGIGYCQELFFRSRTARDGLVSELRWDCRKLKTLLRAADQDADLASAVAQVVSIRRIPARDFPARFFEVELRGVVRHRNDQLLSMGAVRDYLSQVAPVPFHPSFPFGERIIKHLAPHVRLGDLRINCNGVDEPIYRPHRSGLEYAPESNDPYTELELLTMPDHDGEGTGAVGWIAHHGYLGGLPAKAKVRGLRFRSGNVQVGEERLIEDVFPEPRFNGWCVGEVHVVDARIVPNGRRDHFEQNAHYHNMVTHLLPAAREIARRCRTSSLQRKWQRDFERGEQTIKEKMNVIRQGAVTKTTRKRLLQEIELTLSALSVVTQREFTAEKHTEELAGRLENLRRATTRLAKGKAEGPATTALSPRERQVIDLIFSCSPNQAAAKLLVDKILDRLKTNR